MMELSKLPGNNVSIETPTNTLIVGKCLEYMYPDENGFDEESIILSSKGKLVEVLKSEIKNISVN